MSEVIRIMVAFERIFFSFIKCCPWLVIKVILSKTGIIHSVMIHNDDHVDLVKLMLNLV